MKNGYERKIARLQKENGNLDLKTFNSLSSGARKLVFISSDFINGKLNFIEFLIVLSLIPVFLITFLIVLITDAYNNTERRKASTSEYLDYETFFYYLIPISLAILGILISILTYLRK